MIDAINQTVALTLNRCGASPTALGIGCDQLLLVEPATHAGIDFPLPHFQCRWRRS